MNPLVQLQQHGQSVWLDYIRRDLITGGELEIVDGGGSVERDVAHNPAFQPGIHQWPETHLDDVSAQQENHAPAVLLGLHHGLDYLPQVSCGEDIGKAAEEGGEGPVGPWRRRK